MKNYDRFPLRIRELHQVGLKLREELWETLDKWPIGEYSNSIPYPDRAESDKATIDELVLEIERWINELSVEILPNTVHGKSKLKGILNAVRQFVFAVDENKKLLKEEANKTMDEALAFVLSAPNTRRVSYMGWRHSMPPTVLGTALILMEMTETKPELLDVYDAMKEECARFGIEALRADDIPHQDRITDVVIQSIASSEFIIADLTALNPNVLYELGWAEALGKRVILVRKYGTVLPFDLSLHNVPQYKTIGELKKLLHNRLEAMLGRLVA